jgi:TorA maturation chaperone TorD
MQTVEVKKDIREYEAAQRMKEKSKHGLTVSIGIDLGQVFVNATKRAVVAEWLAQKFQREPTKEEIEQVMKELTDLEFQELQKKFKKLPQ